MDCSKWQEQLSKRLDGEATNSEVSDVMEHIAGCEGCKRTFERMGVLNDSLRSLSAPLPRTDLARAAKAVLFGKRTSSVNSSSFAVWRKVPVLIVILLLAVGLGNFAGRSMADLLQERGADTGTSFLEQHADTSLADVVLEINSQETSR